MQTITVKSTQEIINLLESDFKNNLPLMDKHVYFIDTLIKRGAKRKPIYLSSKKLKITFGDRHYKNIVDYFVAKGSIETFENYQQNSYPYNTYKLSINTKKIVEYELTHKPLIKKINYFRQTNYDSLLDFEKQVLKNIEQLQLPAKYKIPSLYIKKSKNTGRLFHTLTNLPKSQRYQLKHKNNIILIEIDAKNAQLVMLSYMFNDDEVFNDAVYSGKFYEILANEMGVDISAKKDRDEFKSKFFKSILFNENRLVVENSKYGIAFKKLFPITFHNLVEMNTDKSKATELQSCESNLFINNITRDLVKSGYFVIPIHDAFIINLDDIDNVTKIINDNCYSVLGRLIKLSKTEFCPTIDCNDTTYNNLYDSRGKEEETSNNNQRAVYVVQSDSKVGQNKKTVIMNEKIEVITTAIKTLLDTNQKITVRKIQELSGVAKSTVEKHYKRILIDLSKQNEVETIGVQNEMKALEIELNEA